MFPSIRIMLHKSVVDVMAQLLPLLDEVCQRQIISVIRSKNPAQARVYVDRDIVKTLSPALEHEICDHLLPDLLPPDGRRSGQNTSEVYVGKSWPSAELICSFTPACQAALGRALIPHSGCLSPDVSSMVAKIMGMSCTRRQC